MSISLLKKRNRAALYYWQSAVQGAGYTITRPFPFLRLVETHLKRKGLPACSAALWDPPAPGVWGDKEPAVDDQLNPSGFVPFSKRDRRGSGVGSRRPPTGSPNHPWRSCSASRRKTTLGSLISLGQCGLKAEARGHLRNMRTVLRVCLGARALNKTPHGSVLGLPCGASLCGTGGRRCGNAPMLPRN